MLKFLVILGLVSSILAQNSNQGNLIMDLGLEQNNSTEYNLTEFEFEFGEIAYDNNNTELTSEEFETTPNEAEIVVPPNEETEIIVAAPEELELPTEEIELPNETEIVIPPIEELPNNEENEFPLNEESEIIVTIPEELELPSGETEINIPSNEENEFPLNEESEVIVTIQEELELPNTETEEETTVVVIPPSEEEETCEDDVDVDVGIRVIFDIVCKGKQGQALDDCKRDIGLQYDLQGSIELNYTSNGEPQNVIKTFSAHN